MMNTDVQPTFFETQHDFRKWLELNHDKFSELFVGYYKVGSGRPSMSWSQSVDQAICFGWIDGVRKSIDSESYFIRFTPRKSGSIWSVVNIKKVEELTKQGLMHPSGLDSFYLRKESKSGIYSYEKDPVKLSTQFEHEFKSNQKAWAFFQTLPASYRNSAIDWVMRAKQEPTKINRLNELINDSEAERRVKHLSYKSAK